jgi:hypothetical protein
MVYEDYKTFQRVQVFGRQPGQLVSVTSAYDAARFVLEQCRIRRDRSISWRARYC